MGRKFTDEENKLMPPEIPWHAWSYSVETHKNTVEKNGEIEFFGKVISATGEPLEGVTLNGEISWAEPSFSKVFATGEK